MFIYAWSEKKFYFFILLLLLDCRRGVGGSTMPDTWHIWASSLQNPRATLSWTLLEKLMQAHRLTVIPLIIFCSTRTMRVKNRKTQYYFRCATCHIKSSSQGESTGKQNARKNINEVHKTTSLQVLMLSQDLLLWMKYGFTSELKI